MTRQQEKTEAMRKSLERTLAIKTREIDEKTRTVDLSFSSRNHTTDGGGRRFWIIPKDVAT